MDHPFDGSKDCRRIILDYEKAFDFVNRAHIINHLKEKGAGARFIRNVASMYEETSYIPKLGNKIGESIVAKHGVTQGRQTSTSFFSFEVQDMAKSISAPGSIMNKHNVLQLADDSALLSEKKVFLNTQFTQCLTFSKNIFMFPNIDKTVFLHLNENTDTEPIAIDESTVIKPAKNKEYVYLGVKFVASNDMVIHIRKNLSSRTLNIHKYNEWLLVNEATPIKVKVHVLYTCMFKAYLYGVEAWWKIDEVADEILLLERKLLKRILCVKSSVPDDIIYLELDRADILASIKQRQYGFFENLMKLSAEEAVARRIVDAHPDLSFSSYYNQIEKNVEKDNKVRRLRNLRESSSTQLDRYRKLIDVKYNHVVYDFLPEHLRIVVTRWRLSNHDLRIETGRYEQPILERRLRTCESCVSVVEDEEHVIFYCPTYNNIRMKYRDLLQKYPQIENIFNPQCMVDAVALGKLLLDIEEYRGG